MLPTLKSALLPLITAPLCRARPIDGRGAALRLQTRAAGKLLRSRELGGRAAAAIAIRSAAAMRTRMSMSEWPSHTMQALLCVATAALVGAATIAALA